MSDLDLDEEQQEEQIQLNLATNVTNLEVITEEEITEAINKLKLGKAAGVDRTTLEMLKYMEDSVLC